MTIKENIFRTFPAFKHRNYQLYFSGQLLSLIGTWLQVVAQGWLVLQLTHSAFWVGVVSAIATLPILVFVLFGGVIVDRLPKKDILIFTQVAALVLAFILGILTVTGIVQVWHIVILALLLGTVSALDMPARQAFAVEMVGKEDLSSAIALNSGIFNGARVIGPAVAGFLIGQFGTGSAFLLNALSYIPVIIALLFIRVNHIQKPTHPHPIEAIKEGLRYSFRHPLIKSLFIFVAITSVFGWSHTTILPVIVQQVFHKDAFWLGYLYAAEGTGALLGSIFVSAVAKQISENKLILGGSVLFALSLILFTISSYMPLALFFLFLSGFGLLVQFATMNSMIQHMVPDNIRGRVMSIYTLMFLGLAPFGSFQMGLVAQQLGSLWAIRLSASVVFIYALFLLVRGFKTED